MPSDLSSLDPLGRFTDRVGDYVRHRPSYPAAAIAYLREKAGLAPGAAVADVGSGTGIFTLLLLDAGARVTAVEPNDAMRQAAEAALGGRPLFRSVKGTAEATGLPDRSVSLVTCAQAFHWFDLAPTRQEFARILEPEGRCAVVWNTPLPSGSDFTVGYEKIKAEFGTDFQSVRHENRRQPERFDAFFGAGNWERRAFAYAQILDLDGLKGRLRSSSYVPKEGQPRFAEMIAALTALFERCQRGGTVRMEYETEIYCGRFGAV